MLISHSYSALLHSYAGLCRLTCVFSAELRRIGNALLLIVHRKDGDSGTRAGLKNHRASAPVIVNVSRAVICEIGVGFPWRRPTLADCRPEV